MPTRANAQIKHENIHRCVFIVHCLATRRLNIGQLISVCDIHRHVFIVHVHTPPLTVSTTGVFMFLVSFIVLSVPAMGRRPPGKKNQIKKDYVHRYFSLWIDCLPGISATRNLFFANDHTSTCFHHVYASKGNYGGTIFTPRCRARRFHDPSYLDGTPRRPGKNAWIEARNIGIFISGSCSHRVFFQRGGGGRGGYPPSRPVAIFY